MDLKPVIEKYIRSELALKNFLEEVKKVDTEFLDMCRELILKRQFETFEPLEVENPPYFHYDRKYYDFGKERFHNFGVITLAGGSATRFFSEIKTELKSKALFPFTENSNFLDLFAGEILASAISSGYIVPWLIMVSDNTADEILNYVEKQPFGFPAEFIFVVKQGVVPRFDDEGFPVVSKDGFFSWTGNGHGGVFFLLKDDISKTLLNHSAQERNMKNLLSKMGVQNIVLHNVDNVFARPTDFVRLGFHSESNSLFTLSAVERYDVEEKIGLIAYIPKKSRYCVMEYSFADPRIFNRMKNGTPYYNIGHINTNIFSLDIIDDKYLKKLKPVLYFGKTVKIDEQVVKTNTVEFLNQMIVNELPADKVKVILLQRDEFFLPTKTISGRDSLETSREKYFSYIRSKMKSLGVTIPSDSNFELAPYFVFGDFEIFDTTGWIIESGTDFYFGIPFSSNGHCISSGFKLLGGAKFNISSPKPFGNIVLDNRKIKGFQNFPRVKIGKNVCVKSKVKITLEEGSELHIRDGVEINKDLVINVRKSEKFVL